MEHLTIETNFNYDSDHSESDDSQDHLENGPLRVPFDLGLAPANFGTAEAPNQEVAMASALMAPDNEHDNGEGFFVESVKMIQLDQLARLCENRNAGGAIGLFRGRRMIDFEGEHVTRAEDPTLCWAMDESYLDLMVCVGQGLGLGSVIPNLGVHHNYEFKMDLLKPLRKFSTKHCRLGFDPAGCMLWIGRSPASEDVWLAFVTQESQETAAEGTGMESTTGKVSTAVTLVQYRRIVMFLAEMVQRISYLDINVDVQYPDVENDREFRRATNIL